MSSSVGVLILLQPFLGSSAWAADGTAAAADEGLTGAVLMAGAVVVAIVVIMRRRLWHVPLPRVVPELQRPETQIVCAAALFVLTFLAAGVARAVLHDPVAAAGDPTAADLAWPAAITYGITVAAASVILLLRRGRLHPAAAARRMGRVRTVLAAIVVLALIWPIMIAAGWMVRVIAVILGADQPDIITHSTLEVITRSEPDSALLVLGACVVLGAPFVEEVIYRVLLQDAFVRAAGKPWPGIVIASVIFTLMHIPAVHWSALVPLFVLSIGLGLLYERTGRIRSIVIAHALFNLFNLLLARMLVPMESDVSPPVGVWFGG